MKKNPNTENEKNNFTSINRRLDGLIRIMLETHYYDEGRNRNVGTAVRMLKSAGVAPTEIAKILGKKDATSIAMYLYSKKKSKKR